jgi:hypothetical protein
MNIFHVQSSLQVPGGSYCENAFLIGLPSRLHMQRAAADCASDPHCVPSVDELVQRAASACAKDPACVCDWGRYPRKCFLSEVQRHKQLVKDAKALEAVLREREEVKSEKLQLEKRLDDDEENFTREVDQGEKAVRHRQLSEAKHDLTQAEYFHQLSERLSGTTETHQLRDMRALAKDIVEMERHGRESRVHERKASHAENRHSRGRDGHARASKSELDSLKKDVSMLVQEVGSLAHKKSAEHPKPAEREPDGSRTRSQIRSLAHDVALLTGKLSELEHNKEWERSRPRSVERKSAPKELAIARTQDLAEIPASVAHQSTETADVREKRVAQERAKVLSHQEITLAHTVADGKAAAARGDLDEARNALAEAKYYHAAIAKLRELPADAPCSQCRELADDISQAELRQRDRTQQLHEEFIKRERQDRIRNEKVKRDEKSFDRALRRGLVDVIDKRVPEASQSLRRARGLLTKVRLCCVCACVCASSD